MRRALDLLEPTNGAVFVDLGCGVGWARTSRTATVPGSWSGSTSRTAVALGNQRIDGVARLQADGCRLPLRDGSIDRLLSFGSLEHFPDPDAGLREIARVLQPQGVAVIVVPNFYVRTEQPRRAPPALRRVASALHRGGAVRHRHRGRPRPGCAARLPAGADGGAGRGEGARGRAETAVPVHLPPRALRQSLDVARLRRARGVTTAARGGRRSPPSRPRFPSARAAGRRSRPRSPTPGTRSAGSRRGPLRGCRSPTAPGGRGTRPSRRWRRPTPRGTAGRRGSRLPSSSRYATHAAVMVTRHPSHARTIGPWAGMSRADASRVRGMRCSTHTIQRRSIRARLASAPTASRTRTKTRASVHANGEHDAPHAAGDRLHDREHRERGRGAGARRRRNGRDRPDRSPATRRPARTCRAASRSARRRGRAPGRRRATWPRRSRPCTARPPTARRPASSRQADGSFPVGVVPGVDEADREERDDDDDEHRGRDAHEPPALCAHLCRRWRHRSCPASGKRTATRYSKGAIVARRDQQFTHSRWYRPSLGRDLDRNTRARRRRRLGGDDRAAFLPADRVPRGLRAGARGRARRRHRRATGHVDLPAPRRQLESAVELLRRRDCRRGVHEVDHRERLVPSQPRASARRSPPTGATFPSAVRTLHWLALKVLGMVTGNYALAVNGYFIARPSSSSRSRRTSSRAISAFSVATSLVICGRLRLPAVPRGRGTRRTSPRSGYYAVPLGAAGVALGCRLPQGIPHAARTSNRPGDVGDVTIALVIGVHHGHERHPERRVHDLDPGRAGGRRRGARSRLASARCSSP